MGKHEKHVRSLRTADETRHELPDQILSQTRIRPYKKAHKKTHPNELRIFKKKKMDADNMILQGRFLIVLFNKPIGLTSQ